LIKMIQMLSPLTPADHILVSLVKHDLNVVFLASSGPILFYFVYHNINCLPWHWLVTFLATLSNMIQFVSTYFVPSQPTGPISLKC
jgi:hypothetical protein